MSGQDFDTLRASIGDEAPEGRTLSPTGRLPWFKFWAVEWLGLTAGLSSDAIALAVQVFAQSWAVGRGGVLVAGFNALERLVGLDSTRTRQALDELSTRGCVVVVEAPESEDGPLTLRVPYLEKQASRREQQSKSWTRRQLDKESTPQAQRLRGSEAQTTREKERLTDARASSPSASTLPIDAAGAEAGMPREGAGVSLSLLSEPEANPEDQRRKDVLEVFAYYRSFHEDSFRNPLPASREWKLIEDRLREGRAADELKLAIDGCHADPFHRGENSWKTPHLQLSDIFPSASKTNALIAKARAPRPVIPEFERRPRDEVSPHGRGWPKWRQACANARIPEEDALAEWQRLRTERSKSGVGSVGKEEVEDFIRRRQALDERKPGEDPASSSASASESGAAKMPGSLDAGRP